MSNDLSLREPLFDAELFSRELTTTMMARNLSTRKVAAEIGISPATVNRIARGKNPDIESFLRVSAWIFRNKPYVAVREEDACETCTGDLHVCAGVPLRHCEKANRENAR